MPPTMMTANALMMKREPSWGSMANAGATSTPASPAMPEPSANVASRTRSTAMPEMLASSGACDADRTARPKRVNCSSHQTARLTPIAQTNDTSRETETFAPRSRIEPPITPGRPL
jgi:hypothetical protein